MLLREIKNIFHNELKTHYPKEEVDSFFYMLIEDQLKLARFVLAMQPDLVISKEEETPLFEALSKLKLQEPIQHIIGETYFMDLDFKVSKDVLIPRPETEELVRWILEEVKNEKLTIKNKLRILDIGTGSGCIAISLAKNVANAEISALDVSVEALEIAKANTLLNDVAVTFIQKDILNVDIEGEFEIIVSNPPYVRELEKAEMSKNVLDFDPSLALFVSDDDPLVFYRRITELASKHLKKNGQLFFEINQYLGKETEQLLKDHNFSEIELRKDMFGNDRMLKATLR